MTIKDWVELMSRRGDVCTDYMRKIAAVETREDMFRVLCDANGGAWLFGLMSKGMPLPIDDFCKEFANYINGQRVMEYQHGYTSKLYCRYKGEIVADTTLVYVFDCKGVDITVPKNRYPSVILSNGSVVNGFVLCDGARLNIEVYGNAVVGSVSGDMGRVRITNR